MKETTVKYLVCPITQSPLALHKEKIDGSEVIEAELISEEDKVYKVENGIAHFIDHKREPSKMETGRSFSMKWNKDPESALSGPRWDFQRQWFLKRYKFSDERKFERFLSNKTFILDAGTGVGRNALWFGKLALNSQVFAIDISESAYHAYQNSRNLNNVHCIRGDISSLPFKDGFFDYIVCDQVIHHTTNPHETFAHLVSKLKKNGEISCYVYKKKAPIREFCDDYIRERTTRMNGEECFEFSESITEFGKALSELNVNIEITKDIPILGIKAGNYDLQRFFYWNIMKCFWNPEYGFEGSVMTNFDWYHPKDAFRYSPEDFRKWFDINNIEILSEDIQDSGVSIHGRKR
jgi:SAM-dependent methyltransferase